MGSGNLSAKFPPSDHNTVCKEPVYQVDLLGSGVCCTDLSCSEDMELHMPGNKLQVAICLLLHLALTCSFSDFQSSPCLKKSFSDPSFLWKTWHQAQRRNTQERMQQPYYGFIFGSSMQLQTGCNCMGLTFGKQHEGRP